MKPSDHVFPVQTATRPLSTGEGFENEIVGGISKRDYIAIELFKGMVSNPAFMSSRDVTVDTLRKQAIMQADRLIVDLEMSAAPSAD